MYRFIVNPAAMGWHSREEWDKIAAKLDKAGIKYETYLTERPGHATELAEKLCAMADTELLGAFGGDGTLNEVAAGYDCEKQIPIFFIPCGSGNDFARGIRLKVTKENAAEYLTDLSRLTAKPVDIGTMKAGDLPERRFVVSAGTGFDAAVCYDMTWHPIKKKLNDLHLGGAGYVILGLKNMLGCPLTDGRLSINSGEKVMDLRKIAFISAHNLPYEGGGFHFAPKATSDDGCIDLCIMTAPLHLWFICCLFGSVFGGRHLKMAGVQYIQCRSAELELSRSLYVHTDGEVPGKYNTVSFKTNENRMTVYQ